MTKEEKVEITKISLEIEGQKISVTPEGAKKLRIILNDLFGKDVQVVEQHHHYPFWWYHNYTPKTWDNGFIYFSSVSDASKLPIASFDLRDHSLEFKVQ